MAGKKQYTLTHTPRQIAEEKGFWYTRSAYEEFYRRFQDMLEPFPLNPEDYPDSIPDDEVFEAFFNEHLHGNGRDLTPEDVKAAFIARCAMLLVDEIDA